MSDDKKKDDKDEKHEKKDAAPKKPLPMGPLLAVVAILALGMGIGFFLSGLVKPAATEGVVEGADGHGETGKDGHAAGKDAHGATAAHDQGLLHTSSEFELGDLTSNVRGQQGRRFVKMNCVLWVEPEVAAHLGGGGGGAHGGGGGGGENIKRILQAAFEEHLKTYDLDELSGPNIYRLLEKSFKEIAEREFRALFHDLKTDRPLVAKVVLTGLLVQ